MRFMKFGLSVAVAMTAAMAASGQQGNTISVLVEGLKNSQGSVRCGLFNSATGFPKAGNQYKGVVTPIANQQATCAFENVPPGTYAVALFHAQNNETEMKTNFLGQPQEAYGFSRNPSTTFGAPSFNDAAYAYPGGPSVWPVKLNY